MRVVDLNLLIYAINEDAPDHTAARTWWEDCLAGDEPIALAWVVILGFVRITTNSRVMPRPLTTSQVLGAIDEWLACPSVRTLSPTERHWEILKRILEPWGTAANLTTDAHLAALAIEHGATLYSADLDFGRFDQLHWVNPLRAARQP